MVYQNSIENKIRARLTLVRSAQRLGIKPTARKFDASKRTVKRWLERWEEKGTRGLMDLSRAPYHIPHKTSKKEEAYIVACRKKSPCYGPQRLKWAYNISASEGAIARIIKNHDLTRKRRKKHQRKRDLRDVKAQYRSLSHHQEDVKHLYDIPNYWPQMQTKKLPKYEWTIRDPKSGFTALAFANEYSELYSTILTEKYLAHLNKFGIRDITIQTDNGSEFGGAKRDTKKLGFVHSIEQKYRAQHVYIPPGMCNANADVESIHATIESELFDLENFNDKQEFEVKAQAYQYFYNIVRPNYSKKGKTPWQIINEDYPEISPRVLFFPVLNLDDES